MPRSAAAKDTQISATELSTLLEPRSTKAVRAPSPGPLKLSRKSATIFGQGTIPEPSTPHIGREVALVARTAAFVYI
jgi:hypothetical protein